MVMEPSIKPSLFLPIKDFLTDLAQAEKFSSLTKGREVRTAPGFSPGCKNSGSLRLYDSCEEDEDSVVEVLVAVASAIKAKGKA